MASGVTTTIQLTDSLPQIIDDARLVREYEGIMPKLCDRKTLSEGEGLSWDEISLSKLTGMRVTETTELDNPQAIVDTLFTITPVVIGIYTKITDRTMKRISKNVSRQLGPLAQNAIQRLKDQDGLAILDGATTSLGGAGVTLTSGHISAGGARASFGGGNEPSTGSLYGVLHSYQVKDVWDELTPVGTYPVPSGMSADLYRKGFAGSLQVAGVEIFRDDLITIDSSDDAKGGVFPREAIVLVQGFKPRAVTERDEFYGGGATEFVMYDEYAYGERSSGNWLYEISRN